MLALFLYFMAWSFGKRYLKWLFFFSVDFVLLMVNAMSWLTSVVKFQVLPSLMARIKFFLIEAMR